jgi:hypothetical protein
MKKLLFILLTLMNSAHGQSIDPVGEYYLRGVMETASGFQLKADSTFLFFYSYGMLDRFGRGIWKMDHNKIILNSRPRPAVDFKLLASRKIPGDSITISIRDNNNTLLRYIHCQLRSASGVRELKTNEEGYAIFPAASFDSLALLFQLCPDRFSVFKADPASNYYEFGFEPWIIEVFFENFSLEYSSNELYGKHPLIQGREFHYEKTGKTNE